MIGPQASGPGRMRIVATALLWAVLTFGGGLLIVMAAPRLIGGQSMAVLSGSMSPAVRTGDQVIVLPVRARDLKVGQIAVFSDPDRPGTLLNHRVQAIRSEGGRTGVVTMGDANSAPERWVVEGDGEVGRVVARIPEAGHLFGRIDPRRVLLGLVVLPALILGASLLASIWRTPEEATSGTLPDEATR